MLETKLVYCLRGIAMRLWSGILKAGSGLVGLRLKAATLGVVMGPVVVVMGAVFLELTDSLCVGTGRAWIPAVSLQL